MLVYLLSIILTIPGYGGHQKRSRTVDVNPTIQYQKFQGWGTSLAWFANVLGGTPDSVRNHYADLIFDVHKGLGLNIVRYNIGGGENPKYHYMEPRAAVPGFEPKPSEYNWSADQNQRWFLRASMKRGVNKVEAFSNSPPYWMTKSGSVTGARNGGNNLKKKYYRDFADYLVNVDQHFQNKLGIHFYSIEPFNEPVSRWWKFGNRQEGCHFGHKAQNAVLKLVSNDLKKDHLTTKLAVPDENSINQSVASFRFYDAKAKEDVDKINTHAYNGHKRKELYQLAQKYHKQLWMSEYGDGDASGLKMSEVILKDLKIMHAQAWVYWQAVDGGGWGLLVANLNKPGPYPIRYNQKYYVLANYSKFIRRGDIIVKSGDEQSVAAYDPSKNELVIVTTNHSNRKVRKTFHIEHSELMNNVVQIYTTSKRRSLHPSKKSLNNNQELSISIPAKSVTTIIFKNVHPN